MDAQLAAALGADDLVPAGTEGIAFLALADALEECSQQALRLGVKVEAVGDGGVAQSTAEDLQGQLCHRAGRQLRAALKTGTLHPRDFKVVFALGQEHEVLRDVGKFIIPAKGAIGSGIHVSHKYSPL